MNPETNLWTTLRERLSPHGQLLRVENGAGPGTADVCYCLKRTPRHAAVTGWLELKQLPLWPARPETPLLIPSLTREQADFLRGWDLAGGHAFLFIRVARTYLLLSAVDAHRIFKRELTRRCVELSALARSEHQLPYGEIVRCLTSDT